MDDAAFNAMHGRVSSVETHMEYVRRDLDEIKADSAETNTILRDVVRRLDELPTKRQLDADRLQWTAIGIGAIALIVTGIIGGLGWLETRVGKAAPVATAPQPIIIQLPAPLSASSRR